MAASLSNASRARREIQVAYATRDGSAKECEDYEHVARRRSAALLLLRPRMHIATAMRKGLGHPASAMPQRVGAEHSAERGL